MVKANEQRLMSENRQNGPIAKRACPGCGSTDVRLASRSGLLAQFLQMFHLHPYRCRGCQRRFFRTLGKENTICMEESHRDTSSNSAHGEKSEGQTAEQF